MYNVSAAFAATVYYQKINPFERKIAEKWCYSEDIAKGFFPVQYCLESLGQQCTGFLPVQLPVEFFLCNVIICGLLGNIVQSFYLCDVVLKVLRQHLTWFFPCNVVWSLLDKTVQGFYLCNVVPRVLRQHWTKCFPCNVVWRLLDNIAQGFYLGQHCLGYLLVQYYPKSIKGTLTGSFHVQCCLEPFGQHCTRFLLVEC